ncbi:hypothetical protein ITJ86_10450 [Winogradskyella sp. F6397]|uniref:Carboxypeptidase regulatory-like domain-containing protein n=1 Tax=Winogradskyella marina TaxID=2785530 RepID=A0ABS0EJK4_9FLAO|nr:hypothetical protein [Winogradskyella marina]MBF8150316.1 hypothetical protein [Winogradskyella marina]
MVSNDLQLFNTLKELVIKTFLKKHNASKSVKDWSGNEIVLFQEDLFDSVKARVSEKWFYTYFKNDAEKLPRVDMLNLLSAYAGYKNWSDFKNSNHVAPNNKPKSLKLFIILPILILTLLTAIWLSNRSHNYSICFIDDIKGQPINSIRLDIKILNTDETPTYLKSNSNGCFNYSTNADYIKFVVQSPYHKTDTIVKSIKNIDHGNVKLNTDDYALMLDYYSNNNIIDWKAHRVNLEKIFSNDALIYQVYPNNIGIELFTKNEFINKLTTPTKSLKQMKILSKTYADGKIVKLKFIIE